MDSVDSSTPPPCPPHTCSSKDALVVRAFIEKSIVLDSDSRVFDADMSEEGSIEADGASFEWYL